MNRIFCAAGANAISLIVSVLTTLLIPKFLGANIEQYGYYQIYLFYTGYIGFFHLGWSDGIYLRFGGQHYEDLDKPIFSSQFWLLTLFEGFISTGIIISGIYMGKNSDELFVFVVVAVNVFLLLPRVQLSYYLQATNRIKEYALITASARFLFGVSVVAIFVFQKIPDYRWFVYSSIIGEIVALLLSMWFCRDIVKTKPIQIKAGLGEAWTNISVGITLMLANIASLLVVGIARWGIQMVWDVETYGKISFTLTVSNLFLTFIGAISLVLFPTLRRISPDKLQSVYCSLRGGLMIPILASLILYYPILSILSKWLPQYAGSMRYMAIMFPLCIFSCRMNMLVQTYMRVLRMEKVIMLVNITGVILASVSTFVFTFLMKSMTLTMVSIMLNEMIRCVLAEICLTKRIGLSVQKDLLFELAMTTLFVVSSWCIGGWMGTAAYTIGYALYLFLKIPDIKKIIIDTKNMLREA